MTWSRKFKTGFFLSTLFVLAAYALFVFFFCIPAKELMPQSAPKGHQAVQKREEAAKDIFLVKQNRERLHYRIESKLSFLHLFANQNKMKLVEEMEQVRCWMEEGSNEAGLRQIRYFETDKGIYDFNTQQFNAKQISVSLYRHDGECAYTFPKEEEIVLQGEAEDVFFSLSAKDPLLQARHFKAHFSLNSFQAK